MEEVFYGTKQKHAVENCGTFLYFIRGCKPFDGTPLFFEYGWRIKAGSPDAKCLYAGHHNNEGKNL